MIFYTVAANASRLRKRLFFSSATAFLVALIVLVLGHTAKLYERTAATIREYGSLVLEPNVNVFHLPGLRGNISALFSSTWTIFFETHFEVFPLEVRIILTCNDPTNAKVSAVRATGLFLQPRDDLNQFFGELEAYHFRLQCTTLIFRVEYVIASHANSSREVLAWDSGSIERDNLGPPEIFALEWDMRAPYSNKTQSHSLSLQRSATCDYIPAVRDEFAWVGKQLEFPRSQLCHLSATAARSPPSILFLGDSEMRTIFQAFISRDNPGRGYADFPQPNTTKHGWCTKKASAEVGHEPRIVENFNDGVLAVYGDGCWGGYVSFIAKAWRVLYIYQSTAAAAFPEVKFAPDVTFIATGHHDQNRKIDAYLAKDFAARNSEVLRRYPATSIILVSSWASDLRKRGTHWPKGVGMRQRAMFKQLQNLNTNVLSFLDITVPVMTRTRDGIHLFSPFPLMQLARLVEHNVCALLTTHGEHCCRSNGHPVTCTLADVKQIPNQR